MGSKSLGIKFSLLLALVWLLGGVATLGTLANHLNTQAEQTVRERAEIVLTAMQSVRNYTQNNIQPLVERKLGAQSTADERFNQEIIPNFAARSIFAGFREQDPSFQDYLYKEAAVNPTNPTDQADAFESEIFPQLQPLDDAPLESRSGYRMVNGQKFFYLAQPLVMNDVSCLGCHSTPERAPQPLIATYGNQTGFGWNLNEIVATQMVYVPADMIFARGRQNLFTVAKTFLSIFVALFVAINLLLWRNVIRPLNVLTRTANRISGGPINPGENESSEDGALTQLTHRQDEPGQLARAVQYMLHVLGQREEDLQQAVNERTASLAQEMRDRKTVQDALQAYAHAMNHDLRNLVMGISTLVQGLLFRSSRQVAESAEQPLVTIEPKALTMIQQSCDRQLKLMSSLMDVQSVDIWRISLRKDSVNLRHLTEELQLFYGQKQPYSAVTIQNQVPSGLPLIEGDFDQLRRVFENLIDNALKYNPDGVVITMTADAWDHDPVMVRCAVRDNGVGIDAAASQDLFQIYARGNTQYSVSGYGLGLYICRKIIEAHGGHIGVETTASDGAEIWFTLPTVE